MEQTNTPQQPSRKKAILSLLVLLALTCVVVFIFSSHWAEISTALAQLSFWQVLLVLAIGLTYPLLEGIVCWLIIRCRLPGFTLRRGMDARLCGHLWQRGRPGCRGCAHGVLLSLPLRPAAGPRCGPDDPAIVSHKTTVLLYATVMLLLQHRWLARNHLRRDALSARRLLRGGAGHRGAGAALCLAAGAAAGPLGHGFLPKTEPWQTRREKWLEQLNTLATESRLLLADKGRCARILAVQTLKLFLMFTLPWFCIRFMGLSCGLSFWQVQLLTSLMLFLSNALPNVAGMGSIETAFLLVFSSFMTSGEAMSTLMLFRIASYYFVFAASAAGTFAAQKHLENS